MVIHPVFSAYFPVDQLLARGGRATLGGRALVEEAQEERREVNGIVLFLLIDGNELPAHIRQTFGLNYSGRPLKDTELEVVREGEAIPDDTRFAVIAYNHSAYHIGIAFKLMGQIRGLHPQAGVFMLPIKG
jgi:hypothetical protein